MPIEADLILAAAATFDATGGVSVLGAGWQVRPADPLSPEALVVILRVPRRQSGTHALQLQLLELDGTPVTVPPPNGPGLMRFTAEITMEGLDEPAFKTPLVGPYAINLPPYPLEPGKEYEWRLHVDDRTHPRWSLPFRTMSEDERAQLG
jgi:hypothetical protein